MNRIKLWLALVIVALVAVLIIQNTDPVETTILFATVSLPRAALLFGTFALGLLTGYLLRMRDATK